MNFNEAINYIYSLGNEVLTMKLGLESISILAAKFGNPQNKYPAVHIAGTNGKGSTSAMVEAVLRVAGYRTALYTSPNLVSITERYQVDGREIDQDGFARLATKVRLASEQLVADGLLESPPTFFEQVTMIAYLHFTECQIDVAVLEVGMGGRLDATNICQPIVTAITPVGFDHQKYLGDTLSAIAGEKAGIIKANVPVIVAPQTEEAMQVISAKAEELNAPLISVADASFTAQPDGEFGQYRLRYCDYDVLLSLRGRHQAVNAMTAIEIVEQLKAAGWKIDKAAVEEGLSKTVWPGRLQLIKLPDLPVKLLIDGAHNIDGVRVLKSFLAEHCQAIPLTLIFGSLNDKAVVGMAELIFPIAQTVILTKADNARSAEPAEIAEQAKQIRQDAICTGNLAEAMGEAARLTPVNGLIVVCGSLYLAGELLDYIRCQIPPENNSIT